METKPPLPPKTLETALIKVQAAEHAWNTRDLERVATVARDHTIALKSALKISKSAIARYTIAVSGELFRLSSRSAQLINRPRSRSVDS